MNSPADLRSYPCGTALKSRAKALPRPSTCGMLDDSALARDFDLAVDIHAHEQAKAEHHGEHRRAAIGDQRHGNADDGDEAHHHRGVDHDVEEEVQRHAHRQQAAELAARAICDLDAIADHDAEQDQQCDTADEAELLAEIGEDEISLLLWQEVELALRPLQEALAGGAA